MQDLQYLQVQVELFLVFHLLVLLFQHHLDKSLTTVEGTFTDGSLTTVGPVMTGTDDFSTPAAQPGTVTTESSQWDGANTLDADSILPSVYSLKEAYPNPFNPTTTIDYTLKESSDVSIVIYDLR